MTHVLEQFGPVMLAYYKPSEAAGSTAGARLRIILSRNFLSRLVRARLFAWSFMDDRFTTVDPGFAVTADAIRRFGCSACAMRR
jgi:hypothetical protein